MPAVTAYRYLVKTENPMTQKSGTRTITASEIEVGDGFVHFGDGHGVVALVRIDQCMSVTRKGEEEPDPADV